MFCTLFLDDGKNILYFVEGSVGLQALEAGSVEECSTLLSSLVGNIPHFVVGYEALWALG